VGLATDAARAVKRSSSRSEKKRKHHHHHHRKSGERPDKKESKLITAKITEVRVRVVV
jgi:UDP-N-acetylmuramyl pentapeptide phosphotransferase/UDP-N-acetylglucosamine-1-phosphate transferase